MTRQVLASCTGSASKCSWGCDGRYSLFVLGVAISKAPIRDQLLEYVISAIHFLQDRAPGNF